MPRVSRAPLGEDALQKLYSVLSSEIISLNSADRAQEFLDGLLTKEEKVMLAKRMMICMMISKGYHTDAIREAIHVSYETVRTYRNQFPHKNKYFKLQLTKLSKQEEMKSLWNRIEELLKPLELALDSHKSMKARAKLTSGDY